MELRDIIIASAAVLITGGVSLIGQWFGIFSAREQRSADVEQKRADTELKRAEIMAMVTAAAHNELKEARASIESLERTNSRLGSRIASLEHNDIANQSWISSLEKMHENLQRDYRELKQQYDELKAEYIALSQTVESGSSSNLRARDE